MRERTIYRLSLPCLAAGIMLSGCRSIPQQAFYVSPFNGNAEDYHPLPQLRDSAHTAIYARTAYYFGSANDGHNDRFNGWNMSAYAAHHFGMFQCYYGLDLSMGNYLVEKWGKEWDFLANAWLVPPAQAAALSAYDGPKFYGSTSFSAAINGVIPFGRSCEWRFLGIETSLHREFGNYLTFREQLPDSLATLDIKSRFYGTLGLTTEIIGGGFRNGEWGIRLATGGILGSAYHNLHIYDSAKSVPLGYSYTDLSFHVTVGRVTGYLQLNSATHATTARVGMAYRITRPRLPHPLFLRP